MVNPTTGSFLPKTPNRVAQQTPVKNASPAQLNQLLSTAFNSVENKLGIAARRLASPYNITLGIASEPLPGAARYVLRDKQALIGFDSATMQQLWAAEQNQPGYGRLVLETLLVNEFFGVLYNVRYPSKQAATKTEELASNKASLQYLTTFYASSPYKQNVTALYTKMNADVQQGVAPYANRQSGSAAVARQCEAIIALMFNR